MDPPSDYNNDQTQETNVKEALDALNLKIGSTNNVWVNSQEPGYENDFFTNENSVKYGIGTAKPDKKLHVDGDVLSQKFNLIMSMKIIIENDNPATSTINQENAAILELINNDPNSSNSNSHFEIANQKNDDEQ